MRDQHIDKAKSMINIFFFFSYQDTVERIYKDFNAHFRICSFDIECFSTDGEFLRADREGD